MRMFSAALFAVLIWACKPLLVDLASASTDFLSLYLTSSLIGLLAGVPLAAPMLWRLRTSDLEWRSFLANSAASGLLLGLWYYAYYRALYEADNQAEISIIAFSWPLIAAVCGPLLTSQLKPIRGLRNWLLLILAFGGTSLVVLTGSDLGSGSTASLWAMAAAVGSGLYLPFAVRARQTLPKDVRSGIPGTLLTLVVTNAFSLLAVAVGAALTGQRLHLATDGRSLAVSAAIGLGVYLVAEVLWTWAIASSGNSTLTSLPYLVPALSVLLLWLFQGTTPSIMGVAGMVLILVANLGIHARPESKEQSQ